MPSVTATIDDFYLTSSWANQNGRYTSYPTMANATKQYTISGIPAGSTVSSAKIAVRIGDPLTGYETLRINNQNASTGEFEQDVQITGDGVYYAAFEFRANGDASMSDGNHSSSCTFKGITITVVYDEGDTPVEPTGSVTAEIPDFAMDSRWTNSGGKYKSRPTQTTATKDVVVSGIPDGAKILTAVFTASIGSPRSGIAILRINGQPADSGTYRQDVTDIVTGNGTYTFTFVFQANGIEDDSDGQHIGSLQVTNAIITVTYETGEPEPEPDPEILLASTELVVLYKPKEKEFKGNGICVLSPSSCTVHEVGGGEYELELEHPFDPYGKYLMLAEDYIIRAPVPPYTIPEITLPAASVWHVKSSVTKTPLYSRIPTYTKTKTPIDRVRENPQDYLWNATTQYAAGYYVIYDDYIYVSNVANTGRQPGTGNEWASTGAKASSGGSSDSPSGGTYDPGTIAEQIPGGELVTKIADYNSTYMQVRSLRGVVGYMKRGDCEESSESAQGQVIPERTIIDQLFRIYHVHCEDDTHTVTVNARHISYDYKGNSLFDCQLNDADPATAIAILQGSLMYEDRRLIACDMTGPTITGDYSFQNPVQALLDPEEGFAAQLHAQVIRDNKDFFLLSNASPRKGPDMVYGVNLRGVSWERDIDETITRIIPRAGDGSKGYVYLDELFVDSPNIDDYAYPRIYVLDSEYSVGQEIEKADGTKQKLTRDDVLEKMREECEKMYEVDKADAVAVTLDVQFLLLGDTEQYKQYKGLQRLNKYDQISVKTGPSGMNTVAQVTEYEWDCLRKRYISIGVGRIYSQSRNMIPGYRVATGAVTYSKLAPGLINKIKGESA